LTPVTQTRFYDPTQPVGRQRGNCLQAVVASLLDLPLDDVPNFVQIDVDGGRNWWDHLVGWLWDRGYAIYGDLVRQPGEYYLASGPSPREQDIHHVVVYRDDELVHDPHPDRAGLLGVTNRWIIRPRGA
jgi:hypothetical protein